MTLLFRLSTGDMGDADAAGRIVGPNTARGVQNSPS